MIEQITYQSNKNILVNQIPIRRLTFGDNELVKLLDDSDEMFKRLFSKKCISKEECKYFSCSFKKPLNLGKLYFLSKIDKKLYDVLDRPVISNCGTPTEKCKNAWITT